jgi:hypothetical protein
MKPKLLLRIAAGLMFLHTIGHSFGALTWKDAPNAAVAAVIASMQSEHFHFMGRESTIAGFYVGYGVSMILVLLFISLLLWIFSTAFNPGAIALMGIFLVALGVVEYIYFFPLAAGFSIVAGLLTLASLRKAT